MTATLILLLSFFLSCQPLPKEVPLEKYRQQYIEGWVFLKEELKAKAPRAQNLLIISVRSLEEPMPLAVLKVKNPELPYHFRISGKHKLSHERLLEGDVILTARLTTSDTPEAQKGDLIGSTPARVGTRGLRVIIDREVE
ncbi:MAG: hypothetical protein RMH93_01715 [Aquificaceae bacterium]|nr:hypothetical protein [Aquificaceae bacterium]